jgi:hypothetical protein
VPVADLQIAVPQILLDVAHHTLEVSYTVYRRDDEIVGPTALIRYVYDHRIFALMILY